MSRLLGASLGVVAWLAVAAPAAALPVTFTNPNHRATGDDPRSVALADFDGDGDLDIAVANETVDDDPDNPPAQGAGEVSILVGQGDGRFVGHVDYPAGLQPRAVVAGHFDTDGDPDLAVANFGGDNVSVLPGAGAATFGSHSTFAVGNGPRALALGFFNANADIDLAVANEHDDNVSVLLGPPGTDFTPAGAPTQAAGGSPSGVAAGDFDGDGDPDLAVANLADDDVSILHGASGGGFDAKVDHPVGGGPRGVAIGDFNGDGDLDLAIPNEQDDNVTILLGGAGATFAPAGTFAVGDAPRAIAAADFTRDGDPDLVTANDQGDGATLIVGGLGATFSAPVGLPAGDAPFSVAAGDLNGDGEQDLVVGNLGGDNVSILLNRTPPDTTVDSGPQGLTSSTTPAFGFSPDEPGVKFECRVDQAAFAGCESPFTVPALGDGGHVFEVRATDPAGNLDATAATRAFTVDSTPPQSTVDSGPPLLTNATSVTFGFSSSEPGSTFQCRLDGAAFAACAPPITISGINDGPHSFEFLAIDQAGNADPTPATRAFTVDATGPQTTIDSGPTGSAVGLNPTFAFRSSEPGTFECRVDTGAFAPCSSPFTTPALAPGPHSFEVRATDVAGNLDQSAAKRSFTALLRITSQVGNTWKAARVTRVVRLVASDVPRGAKVEVRCSSRKRGCRFTRKTVRRNSRGLASATRLFRGARLRPGATVEVRVTARYAIGRVVRFNVRRGAIPRKSTLCLAPGKSRPGRC